MESISVFTHHKASSINTTIARSCGKNSIVTLRISNASTASTVCVPLLFVCIRVTRCLKYPIPSLVGFVITSSRPLIPARRIWVVGGCCEVASTVFAISAIFRLIEAGDEGRTLPGAVRMHRPRPPRYISQSPRIPRKLASLAGLPRTFPRSDSFVP